MKQKILFVAGEGLPFIKTGGLADVVGSLSKELAEQGQDVRVFLPLYQQIRQQYLSQLERIGSVHISSGWIHQPATYYQATVNGVIYYFVEHQGYYERDQLYGYWDDGERFAFFQSAVLDSFGFLNWWPDVIHAHDWQAGMLSVLAKRYYPEQYHSIKHVYTIHNLAFQGNFGKDMLASCLGMDEACYWDGSIRLYDGISFMKAGIMYADEVTTVSQTYAEEILTPTFGEHMDSILNDRREHLSGIVNGIDITAWNPKTDVLLEKNYDVKAWKRAKQANKKALQKRLGLQQNKDVCLIGVVSRLTWQKGLNLLIDKLNQIMHCNVQLVILGTGESGIEAAFHRMSEQYTGKAIFYRGYNESLAHLIYAASDIFLMPSYYEPCGIGQLLAMRYGALPLVRETGGLKDTVAPYNEYTKEGTGFSFANMNSDEMFCVLEYALKQFYDAKKDWYQLVENAMKYDVSWAQSAQKYLTLYQKMQAR